MVGCGGDGRRISHLAKMRLCFFPSQQLIGCSELPLRHASRGMTCHCHRGRPTARSPVTFSSAGQRLDPPKPHL
eukprot:5891336-Pyramimonas_sp.AAC.1